MTETIKEIYDNITLMFNHITNNYLGSALTPDLLAQIKYTVNNTLKTKYPYYFFNLEINYNNYTQSITIDLNPDLNTFPKISYKNYHSHNFIEVKVEDTYWAFPILKCNKCALEISENGNLIDGNYSCEEYQIKKLVE